MPMTQTTTYKCEHCGLEVAYEGVVGPMPGPVGWISLNTATGVMQASWFDKWACVRDYAAAKVPVA